MKVYQRLDALTSLRFFAAAMIVISHIKSLGLWGYDSNTPPFLNWELGVSFFFVLSGFILAYIYPKLDTWHDVMHFWHARFARIWPAFFVSFVLAFWLLSLGWNYKIGLANLLLVSAWIPYPKYFFSYNSPSWSISAEFFFYIAFPFLIFRWDKNWHIKLLVSGGIIAVLILVSNSMKLPSYGSLDDDVITRVALLQIHPVSRIFEFIFGMVVASYWRIRVEHAQWSVSRATIYEIGAILLAIASLHYLSPLAQWAGATWLGLGTLQWLNLSGGMFAFGLLIYVMAIGRGRISALISHPVLVLMGEISFSLYLLHLILLTYYSSNLNLFPKLSNALSLAIFWITILLSSYVMWSLIEMPCRRLILGRRQKDMHGTKVMQQSWHTHLNLNRKTLSAAFILCCIVISIYISMGNNPKRISEDQADAITPNELKYVSGTRFGNLFMLRGIRIVRKPEGLVIFLAWESLIEEELTYTSRLYLTDVNGNNLFYANFRQPKTRNAEKQGAIWGDKVLIPADKLTGMERKLAITLYQVGSDPLPVDRGDRDWNGHRLLISLDGTINPASHK